MKKITELQELTSIADGDFIPLVDVSDTNQSVDGTTKKITKSNIISDIYRKTEVYTKAEADAAFVENTQIDTDGTLAANSDTKIPSQKAVKTYADTSISAISDWKSLPALAWVSQDGSTNVVNATGDMTSTLSSGMRLKTQQDQALTAYWNFNSDSTSQVGSFNGTDTAMTYTAGKFGNAATFNGTTSKIVIADNASLKPTGEFTIGCWFKKTGAGTQQFLFQSFSANTNFAGIVLNVDTTNVLRLLVGKNTGAVAGTDYTTINGVSNVADNSWHYAVISYRNNYAQIYVDGKLDGAGYCLTPAYAATNYLRVGCYTGNGTESLFLAGQIDDLFLINGYALDEKTIKKQYDLQTAQGTGNITIDKYALVTAVGAYSAPNTPITIWGGTDYSLANATISSPYYATVSQPFGLDRNPAKWTCLYRSGSSILSQAATTNTWYNMGTQLLSVPIGCWELGYLVVISADNSSTNAGTLRATLSKSSATEDDNIFTVAVDRGAIARAGASVGTASPISLITKTSYYLNSKTAFGAGTETIYNRADINPTIIRAVSTLL